MVFGMAKLPSISIHAPTWGATLFKILEPETWAFQSTHPRGVRLGQMMSIKSLINKFQSTHPRGVRLGERLHTVQRVAISIHAPTWGATALLSELNPAYRISIHAPTWGATLDIDIAKKSIGFQSTHPRGVRPRRSARLMPIKYFNPRTHVGCDQVFGERPHNFGISIHAPTWGATV